MDLGSLHLEFPASPGFMISSPRPLSLLENGGDYDPDAPPVKALIDEQQMIMFQPQPEWRHPNRPVMQMLTNYVFVSDDPLFINQYPPFLNYTPAQRPGVFPEADRPPRAWPGGRPPPRPGR